MDLATFRARVRNAVKDLDSAAYYWADAEIDAAIARAVGEYNRVAPLVASMTKNGDGATRSFDCSAEADYLYALAVEYPIDQDPPAWLAFRELTRGSIVILGNPPVAGSGNVRIWLAKAHGTAPWTVPAEDERAIEAGAVGYLALAGARYSAGRLNASQGTPGQLLALGEAGSREFAVALDSRRARSVGPAWLARWDL